MADTPTPGTDPILAAHDITVRFGGLTAVDGVSLDVDQGSIVALIGPNGAGKSTFFNAITGFQPTQSGTVTFEGRDVTKLGSHKRARRGLVRTFQLPRVFARMKVLDNLMLASPHQPAQHLRRALVPVGAQKGERRVRARADELLETFSLTHMQDMYAGELSGGQRKLLELARALMVEPRMLLLDEPMAGVNPALGDELIAHITRLRDEQGMTFFFVEHDMDIVMNYTDRVVCMAEGRVIADGTAASVRSDPQVLSAYLGDDVQIEL